MERNGFTKEFLIIILVLGVFTIVMLSTTSYAYKDNSDDYYLQVINVIEKQAVLSSNFIASAGSLEKLRTVPPGQKVIETRYRP